MKSTYSTDYTFLLQEIFILQLLSIQHEIRSISNYYNIIKNQATKNAWNLTLGTFYATGVTVTHA